MVPEWVVNMCARAAYESIPVDEQDHIGGWLELHAEAREFWRHRARFVLQAFHEMRRSTIHETPEIGGSRWEDPRNLSGGWTDVE